MERVIRVGADPAGLYLAAQLKALAPECDVEIAEAAIHPKRAETLLPSAIAFDADRSAPKSHGSHRYGSRARGFYPGRADVARGWL